MYAFDVHCNSYFPLFVLLYVVQFALCPVLLAGGFLPTVLSNLLYGAALSYYHYTQFLGYNGTSGCMTEVEKRWLKSSYFSTFRLSAKRREQSERARAEAVGLAPWLGGTIWLQRELDHSTPCASLRVEK